MGRIRTLRGEARETADRLELRALERMAATLCRHVEQLADEARARGRLETREAALQLEAFAERRAQAERLLRGDSGEPLRTRIARLEKTIEALDCSRTYFKGEG